MWAWVNPGIFVAPVPPTECRMDVNKAKYKYSYTAQ
jgi:hypothetical protein